jgi:hypothetical protein
MGIVRSRKGGACRRSCGRREKEIVPGELGRVQYPVGDGAQTEGWQVVWVVGPGQFGSRSLQRAQHDVIADRAWRIGGARRSEQGTQRSGGADATKKHLTGVLDVRREIAGLVWHLYQVESVLVHHIGVDGATRLKLPLQELGKPKHACRRGRSEERHRPVAQADDIRYTCSQDGVEHLPTKVGPRDEDPRNERLARLFPEKRLAAPKDEAMEVLVTRTAVS